jgi:hypothetical protein
MLLLADLLDNIEPQQFNIQYWASDYDNVTHHHSCQDDFVDLSAYKCNTAACIAGWAVALQNDLEVIDCPIDSIEERAMEYLGLGYDDKQRLFYYGSGSIWGEHCDELGLAEDDIEALSSKDAAAGLRLIVNGNWEL